MKKKKNITKATSYQVAELAGVSQSAVSRAYKPGASISAKTRKRIYAAAGKLGYQPNAIARSLISNRSNMIGIVMADVNNPFYPAVLDMFVRKLQEKGQKSLVLMATRDQHVDELLPQLLEYQVDGLVITSATLSTEMADHCVSLGTPVVLFNRYVPDTRASLICCDNEGGARRIADLLIKSGHTQFAFIAGITDTSTNLDREKGFRAQLDRHGLAKLRYAEGYYSYEGGYRAALDLFRKKPQPDAIFCANDIMAMGAMDAIRKELGLIVPADVSVVGFDDIANARWPVYDLTTVKQPVSRMVDRSISNLMERARNPESPQVTELLAGELIIRSSTR